MQTATDKSLIVNHLKRVRIGSHGDIMFIISPYAALLLQNIWSGSFIDFFTSPYLSVLNATIAGLTISKYVQCLAYNLVDSSSRSRAASMVGFITLFGFIPSIILAINISISESISEVVTYVQFTLFVFTFSMFFSYLGFINLLVTDDSSTPIHTNDPPNNNFPVNKLTGNESE